MKSLLYYHHSMIWYFQIIGLVISMLWSHRMILSMINYRSLFNLYDMILLHNLGIFCLLWYYHSSSIIVYKKSIWMESHGIARNFDSKSIIRSSIISSFHCLSVNFYTQIYAPSTPGRAMKNYIGKGLQFHGVFYRKASIFSTNNDIIHS